MAEYGYRGRNESQDSNAKALGTEVATTTQRTGVAHDAPVDGPRNSLSQGAITLASSISEVAEVAKTQSRKESTTRLALQASAEQGTNIAINDIAKDKKRSPLMAAVLGRSVTAQVSEAQSISNAAQALSNHAMENMSKLAELPTDQAIQRLTEKSEDLISEIQDPELRQVAFNSLKAQMPKLAQAHYKERYALERNKQIENNRQHIVNNLTGLKYDLKMASTADSKNAIIDTYAKQMFDKNDPMGVQDDELSTSEYRGLVLSQMATDLQNGDKTLYDVARRIEEKGELTQTELDALKDSEGKYDSYQNTQAEVVISGASLGLGAANSYQEYMVAANIARADLVKWTVEGTQSEIDAKNQINRKAQLERMIASGAKGWASNSEGSDRLNDVRNYGNLGVNGRAAMGTLTRKEQDIAADAQIDQMVSGITGWNTEKSQAAMDTMLAEGLTYTDRDGNEMFMNPVQVAQNITQTIKRKGLPAGGFVKRFVEAQLDGMAVGQGENGKSYTPQQEKEFRVSEALVAGNPSLGLSADDLIKLDFMRWGFNAKASPDLVQNRIATWQNNRGKDMSGIKAKDVANNVKAAVKAMYKKTPTDSMMSTYNAQYGEILKSVNYDHTRAKAIFSQTLAHGSSSALGLHVANGKELDERLDGYTLDSLFGAMKTISAPDEYGQTVTMATPVLMTMFGTSSDTKQQNLIDMKRANITGIEYIPGDDAVWINGIEGTISRIPMTELERVVEGIKQQTAMKREMSIADKLINALGAMQPQSGIPDPAELAKEAQSMLK